MPADTFRLERTYAAPPEEVWELWTTPAGIESWWAPDGFRVDVTALDLRPGGELVYAMTATAPEQVEFMRSAGMPLTNESRKTFTEVEPPHRLAYRSLVDFVPDHDPYEQLTTIELRAEGDRTTVIETAEAMHDDVWTERLRAGRENELANLAAVIERRRRS